MCPCCLSVLGLIVMRKHRDSLATRRNATVSGRGRQEYTNAVQHDVTESTNVED